MKDRRANNGGKRQGAGRPKEQITISIDVTEEAYQNLLKIHNLDIERYQLPYRTLEDTLRNVLYVTLREEAELIAQSSIK